MPRRFTPRVDRDVTPVRHANPVSVFMAAALGALHGRGINGETGTIRYGYPQIGMRAKYQGYANPPQMFVGWNPSRVAAGAVRPTLGGLPGTQAPYSDIGPLLAAVSRVPTKG